MKTNLMYHEVFDLFEKAEKRAEKIEVLRKHADNNFKFFLMYAFHPGITFDVPIPEYKASNDPAGLNVSYLHNEIPKLYRFIVDHPKRPVGISIERQSQLLIQVLEALHKDEADLLVRCIKKELKIPFLTVKLIREAFPGIDLGEAE